MFKSHILTAVVLFAQVIVTIASPVVGSGGGYPHILCQRVWALQIPPTDSDTHDSVFLRDSRYHKFFGQVPIDRGTPPTAADARGVTPDIANESQPAKSLHGCMCPRCHFQQQTNRIIPPTAAEARDASPDNAKGPHDAIFLQARSA